MNSVEMRVPGGSSRALFATCSIGTARTIRIPCPVPLFAYESVASVSTSAAGLRDPVPSGDAEIEEAVLHVAGISCGRSSETRSIRSSSIEPW